MTTLFKSYYLFLLLAFGMLACQDEESKPGTGEIQFAINDLLQNSSGRTAAVLPDGASLLISVEDASGNAIFTLKKLDLLSFGGQYTSAPLKLENGSYKLTDFLIVNESNAVVYATPRAGSPFANLVSRPLPVSFTISTGQSTSVPTQVVRANDATPEDFGYATFPISIAPYPEFSVSVFAFRVGQLRLTSAQAYLLHDGDTIYRKYLGPQTSDIVFKGEQDETYTFVLVRPGFAKYSHTFVLSELREELDGEPLEIVLQPAVTMSILPGAEGVVEFNMDGIVGKKVVIDWGDGTTSEVTFANPPPFDPDDPFPGLDFNVRHHEYADPNYLYFVSMTGDIDAISGFGFGWTGNPAELSFEHAVNLSGVALHFNFGVDHVDFSANKNLERLSVAFAYDVKSINIANNKKLNNLSLGEIPALPASELNKVIGNLYQNAVDEGIYHGTLSLNNINGDIMDQLTPESIEKVRTLRDQYSWWIEPEIPE